MTSTFRPRTIRAISGSFGSSDATPDTGEVLATSEPGLNRVANGGGVVVATRWTDASSSSTPTRCGHRPAVSGHERTRRRPLIDNDGQRPHGRRQTARCASTTSRRGPSSVIRSASTPGYSPTAALAPRREARRSGRRRRDRHLGPRPSEVGTAACRLAGRNLTQAEWDQYIGDLAPYTTTCPDHPAG